MAKESVSDQDAPRMEHAPAFTDGPFLEALRAQMLKFATLQLSDSHLAEDTVQEALTDALKNIKSFGGKAALKTWVFAILKNKIADVLRRNRRLINAGSLLRDDDEDFAAPFDREGFWQPGEHPRDWGDPQASFDQQQFWRVFEACLEGLPPKQARVFMMREFIELETEEICAAVDISMSNLFVMLHRARLRLGKCLEHKWFIKETPSC